MASMNGQVIAEPEAKTAIGKTSAPSAANAWSRPLQAKRTTAPPPGMESPAAKTSDGTNNATKSLTAPSLSSVMLDHRERLLHLSLSLVGQKVVLQQTDGTTVEGIFYTFTPFTSLPAENKNKYVLKEIRILKQGRSNTDSEKNDAGIASSNGGLLRDGATLIVSASKVVYLHAKNVDLTRPDRTIAAIAGSDMNGSGGGLSSATSFGSNAAPLGPPTDLFVTDTQISGGNAGRNRDLVAAGSAWTTATSNNNDNSLISSKALGGTSGISYQNQAKNTPLQTNSRAAALGGPSKDKHTNSKGSSNAGLGTSNTTGLMGSIGEWDQFKANEELFNVNATFDENLYTTQLDKSSIDAKRIAEAERIAREIETTTTANIHLAEERGFKVETDFDEEDLYSGVLTKDGKQRHDKQNVRIMTKKDLASRSGEKENTDKSRKEVGAVEADIKVSSSAPKKVMNYAAAAAKADGSQKIVPPGFTGSSAPAAGSDAKEERDKSFSTASPVPITAAKEEGDSNKETLKQVKEPIESSNSNVAEYPLPTEGVTKQESKKAETSDATKESEKEAITKAQGDDNDAKTKEAKKDIVIKTSKLNANAKAFTFNPQAKSFTPSFGSSAASGPGALQPLQSHGADPNMQFYGGGHPMQPPHYMQAAPMGQPGMMPMMNPQYPNMRYPPQYGLEQHVPQMPHQQPQHSQVSPHIASAPSSGNAMTPTPGSGPGSTNNDDDSAPTQDGESSQGQSSGQQQRPQQPQSPDQLGQPQGPLQHQQMSMPYNVPPGAYFAGGAMGVPPRGPTYPPHFVAGPQQLQGRPGVAPYGVFPMQPAGMAHNMQMRGPNGTPYYHGPNGPIPYPPGTYMGHGMIDEGGGDSNYRGRGGRGPGSSGRGGRGRGGRSRGGRGRGNYNNVNHQNSSGNNSGRNTPQQQHQRQTPPTPQGHASSDSPVPLQDTGGSTTEKSNKSEDGD